MSRSVMSRTENTEGDAPSGVDIIVSPSPDSNELHFEGFPLEAVLTRVYAEQGAGANIVSADRVRRGGVGGFFARELFRVTVKPLLAPTAVADEELNFVPLGRISIFDDADRDDADRRDDDIDPEDIDGALALGDVDTRTPADDEMWALLAQARLQPGKPVLAVAPAVAEVPTRPVDQLLARALMATPPPPPLPVPEAPSTHARVVALRPRRVRRTMAPPLDLESLIAEFESAGPPPGLLAQGLIAVVGGRDEAAIVCARLATVLGIPAESVIVAAPQADLRIPSQVEVSRLAASARYEVTPVAVVMVELQPGREGHVWARVVLDGLGADQIRMAADTDRLLAQQHLSIAAIGGVDVIDLLEASVHEGPEEILEMGIPIATIDGRPATAELWAATVLASRLRHLGVDTDANTLAAVSGEAHVAPWQPSGAATPPPFQSDRMIDRSIVHAR